ncbi:DUF2058 family protein [Pseudomonas gelidaquae]
MQVIQLLCGAGCLRDIRVSGALDEDDPYAAYQIPDDLMW